MEKIVILSIFVIAVALYFRQHRKFWQGTLKEILAFVIFALIGFGLLFGEAFYSAVQEQENTNKSIAEVNTPATPGIQIKSPILITNPSNNDVVSADQETINVEIEIRQDLDGKLTIVGDGEQPLQPGFNAIAVSGIDEDGNTYSATTVVYRGQPPLLDDPHNSKIAPEDLLIAFLGGLVIVILIGVIEGRLRRKNDR